MCRRTIWRSSSSLWRASTWICRRSSQATKAALVTEIGSAMITALLLYAYCSGLCSSRRIAKACAEREARCILPLTAKCRYQTWASVFARIPCGATSRASSDVAPFNASCCGSAATPPIARLAMSNDQKVSSRGLWRTFHVQSPSRLGKAHLYLASRQPVELPIPASTHLLRKSSQIQGFIARTKAEPDDQIAGDCCDLLSRRVKEWQSHRGTLVVNAVRESSTLLRFG